MGEFSLSHWLIILVILLLFFGPSKLPSLGSSLGKAIRGFKSGLNETDPPPNQANASRPEQISQSEVGQTTEQTAQKTTTKS
jgi:sec-independent protein translocase protein TatA